MQIRIAFVVAIALLLPSLACDKTYPVRFVCEPDRGGACPPGDECPVVPEGPDACGDVPGVLGHDPMPIDMARPVGCNVGLPFGNAFYGDSQQTCVCLRQDPSAPAAWWCGV